MSCTPCGPCGGKKWETTAIPGKKFDTKEQCQQAEAKELQDETPSI